MSWQLMEERNEDGELSAMFIIGPERKFVAMTFGPEYDGLSPSECYVHSLAVIKMFTNRWTSVLSTREKRKPLGLTHGIFKSKAYKIDFDHWNDTQGKTDLAYATISFHKAEVVSFSGPYATCADEDTLPTSSETRENVRKYLVYLKEK